VSRSGWSRSAIVAVVVQLAVLYVPRTPQVGTGALPVDKLAHALVFAVPVVALVAAGLPRAWVVAAMAIHAPLSEVLQDVLLAGRSGDPTDVVADLVGVVIGAWLARPGGRIAVAAGSGPEPT
jgi:VanZ family protein